MQESGKDNGKGSGGFERVFEKSMLFICCSYMPSYSYLQSCTRSEVFSLAFCNLSQVARSNG
jgi:hypothetical protein